MTRFIFTLIIANVLLFSNHEATAQSYQNNNQGVITNVVVLPPAKSNGELLQDALNNRPQINTQSVQYETDQYMQQTANRAAARAALNLPGSGVPQRGLFKVVKSSGRIYSSINFDATDAIMWTLPVGTLFRFRSTPSPGGVTEIELVSMSLSVPANYNGFSYIKQGTRTNGYIQWNDVYWEQVSE